MKRPCGVIQTALREEARIARMVRKNLRAPIAVCCSTPKKPRCLKKRYRSSIDPSIGANEVRSEQNSRESNKQTSGSHQDA